MIPLLRLDPLAQRPSALSPPANTLQEPPMPLFASSSARCPFSSSLPFLNSVDQRFLWRERSQGLMHPSIVPLPEGVPERPPVDPAMEISGDLLDEVNAGRLLVARQVPTAGLDD